MKAELGENWADRFSEFERVPIASASIGQVHRAKAAVSGLPVAVKVQFPGIASSITSDLDNLSLLLKTSALLPRGLYLDNTLAVMRRELADECDYVKEAASGRRFREMLKDDPLFEVPQVIDELTSTKVLTTEFMSGRPLSEIKHLDQATRDKVGTILATLEM
jgi:aarF domain-containing kinase